MFRDRAVRFRGEIYTDPSWHLDALKNALRAHGVDREDVSDEEVNFGYVNEDGQWEDLFHNRNYLKKKEA